MSVDSTELTDDALRVFLHYHRFLMVMWEHGWMFAVVFCGLLYWSIVYSFCASSPATTQIQVFSYPLAISTGLAVMVVLLDRATHSLSQGRLGWAVGGVVMWLFVSSLANFTTIALTYWSPSGSTQYVIIASALLVVVFIAAMTMFYGMRRVRDKHVIKAHNDQREFSHAPTEEEEHVLSLVRQAEEQSYAQSGMASVMGMPLVSRSNLLYRMSQTGHQMYASVDHSPHLYARAYSHHPNHKHEFAP